MTRYIPTLGTKAWRLGKRAYFVISLLPSTSSRRWEVIPIQEEPLIPPGAPFPSVKDTGLWQNYRQTQYRDLASGHRVFQSWFSPYLRWRSWFLPNCWGLCAMAAGAPMHSYSTRASFHRGAHHTFPGIWFKWHLHSIFIRSLFQCLLT